MGGRRAELCRVAQHVNHLKPPKVFMAKHSTLFGQKYSDTVFVASRTDGTFIMVNV